MMVVNRSLVVLKPKQPFLEWIRSLDDEIKDLTLEALSEDSTAYLLPEIWDDSERDELLKSYYEFLFEEELETWWLDETRWPQKRNFKAFLRWFEVEWHTTVIDLSGGPVYDDEYDLYKYEDEEE